MVGASENEEIPFGFTADGLYQIILRPMRGPMAGFRPRTPPPLPPPFFPPPPRPPRTPSPPPPPSSRPVPPPPTERPRTPGGLMLPVSGGGYATTSGDVITSSFKGSVTISTDGQGRRTIREVGRRVIKEEVKEEGEEECRLPPFTSLLRPGAGKTPPPRPPPPRWLSPRSLPRPETLVLRDPPPPYPGGLVVTEAPQSPPYVTARTAQGLYPELPPAPPAARPSAPPSDEGYGGASGSEGDEPGARGVVRPHSDSPFIRNVRTRTGEEEEEEVDMKAISYLLDFAVRGSRAPPRPPPPVTSLVSPDRVVRAFRTSTPRTPEAAARLERPPRITSRRIIPLDTPRPRPLRSTPPSAALGAPPQQEEEEEELPDIPDTPRSPTVSDITILSTLSTYSGYSSDEMSEYEYADPFEDEGPYSQTPPPVCDGDDHKVCVPPAWGERIPGPGVSCMCLLCHQDDLCRAGDPLGEDPLGESQHRRYPVRREEISYRGRRGGRVGGMLVGIGRARGRGRPRQGDQQEDQQVMRVNRARRGRRRGGRGRSNGRGTTIEEEKRE